CKTVPTLRSVRSVLEQLCQHLGDEQHLLVTSRLPVGSDSERKFPTTNQDPRASGDTRRRYEALLAEEGEQLAVRIFLQLSLLPVGIEEGDLETLFGEGAKQAAERLCNRWQLAFMVGEGNCRRLCLHRAEAEFAARRLRPEDEKETANALARHFLPKLLCKA